MLEGAVGSLARGQWGTWGPWASVQGSSAELLLGFLLRLDFAGDLSKHLLCLKACLAQAPYIIRLPEHSLAELIRSFAAEHVFELSLA